MTRKVLESMVCTDDLFCSLLPRALSCHPQAAAAQGPCSQMEPQSRPEVGSDVPQLQWKEVEGTASSICRDHSGRPLHLSPT